MKTRIVIFAAALAALAASCQKIDVQESAMPGTEPAVITTGIETKTSLTEKGEVNWTAGDKIAVFDNANTKNEFTTAGVNGSYAVFTGNVTEGTTQIYAVYPYEFANSAVGSTITVTIPAEQTSKAGSFAEEHNISVAKANKEPGNANIPDATFRNVCALLKFTVPSYIGDVTKVTITGDKAIAGNMTVDYSGQNPAVTVAEDGSKSISMEGSFAAGSTFWFVVAPVTLSQISVDVVTAQGTYSMSKTANIAMSASKYKDLGTLELQQATLASATAAHTYQNNTLTGTIVNVNLGIDATTLKYMTGVNLKVIKRVENESSWWEDLFNIGGGNTEYVIREYTSNNAAASFTIPATVEYPYLPSGEYIVTGSYMLGEVEKQLGEIAVNVGSPFTGEGAPSFTAKYNVYTSYTKYANGDIAGANALNGSAIYIDVAQANISDAILAIFGKHISATLTFENGKVLTTDEGFATVSGKEFGSYTLQSIASSFDGSNTCTSTAEAGTYHITGIPYNYSFIDSNQGNNRKSNWTNEGWTIGSGVQTGATLDSYSIGGAIIHQRVGAMVNHGTIASPKFAVPENSFNIVPSMVCNGFDIMNDKQISYTLYVGSVSNASESNTNSLNKTIKTAFNADGVAQNFDNTLNISSDNPYISISCDSPSETLSFLYTHALTVHSVSFNYAE